MPSTPHREAEPGTPRYSARTVCAGCGAGLRNGVVCDECGALVADAFVDDPFLLLGLSARFEFEPAAIDAAYRTLARKIHPDRFATATDEIKALAARLSAELNHAQQIIHDPVRRTDYLLVKAGGPTAAELREVPGDLLVETMTLREELEEAKVREDAVALAGIRKGVVERRERAMLQIAIRALQLPNCDAAEKTDLRRQLNAMKYYDNLLAEIPAEDASGGRNLLAR